MAASRPWRSDSSTPQLIDKGHRGGGGETRRQRRGRPKRAVAHLHPPVRARDAAWWAWRGAPLRCGAGHRRHGVDVARDKGHTARTWCRVEKSVSEHDDSRVG